jgi:endonuclease/exonuclease/phosphatase family metal-dependent hydrolase
LTVDPVLGYPPARLQTKVRDSLLALREGLDQSEIPVKRLDHNLLIATWNIRIFGGLTQKWQSTASDRPKRNLHDIYAIAEIVSRFDVIAIQEAREDLKALQALMKVLGPDWGVILTDVTWGDRGNGERLAFIFDLRRVKPAGLAGELVVPDEWLARSEEEARKGQKIRLDGLYKQFARTPYAVSFQCAGKNFTLITVHIWYGDKDKEREPEIRAIAEWLSRWAGRAKTYRENFIVLGDFNIEHQDDPNWRALTSKGLKPPKELDEALRTISDKPGRMHYYDQIAWFTDNGKAKLELEYTERAGFFEWTKHLLASTTTSEKAARISDHYPLWAEFLVRRSVAADR